MKNTKAESPSNGPYLHHPSSKIVFSHRKIYNFYSETFSTIFSTATATTTLTTARWWPLRFFPWASTIALPIRVVLDEVNWGAAHGFHVQGWYRPLPQSGSSLSSFRASSVRGRLACHWRLRILSRACRMTLVAWAMLSTLCGLGFVRLEVSCVWFFFFFQNVAMCCSRACQSWSDTLTRHFCC